MKINRILLIASFSAVLFFVLCRFASQPGNVVSVENGKIKVEFERSTGRLVSFSDRESSYGFIAPEPVSGLPWEVNFASSPEKKIVPELKPEKFSYSKPDALTLILTWKKFEGRKDLSIQAKIRLDKDKALSYWSIRIEGMQGQPIEKVAFPCIRGIKDLGNEELAVATWMGSLIRDPRAALAESNTFPKQMSWSYPGSMGMQLMTFYHPGGQGLYASCNDTLSFAKDFSVLPDTLNFLQYRLVNYPELNPGLQASACPEGTLYDRDHSCFIASGGAFPAN